jgi:hypothetical protein
VGRLCIVTEAEADPAEPVGELDLGLVAGVADLTFVGEVEHQVGRGEGSYIGFADKIAGKNLLGDHIGCLAEGYKTYQMVDYKFACMWVLIVLATWTVEDLFGVLQTHQWFAV